MARAVLDMLIKSNLEKSGQILQYFSNRVPQTPLLFFVQFFMEAVKMRDLELIKRMANTDFAKILQRDPSLYEKVNAIVEKNFEG